MLSNRDAVVLLGHSVGVLAGLAAEVGHGATAAELVRRPQEGLRRNHGVVGRRRRRSAQRSWEVLVVMTRHSCGSGGRRGSRRAAPRWTVRAPGRRDLCVSGLRPMPGTMLSTVNA